MWKAIDVLRSCSVVNQTDHMIYYEISKNKKCTIFVSKISHISQIW